MNIFCYCQQAEDGDGGPEREDPPQNASFKTSQIRQMFLVCKVSRWASVSQTQYISNLQKGKLKRASCEKRMRNFRTWLQSGLLNLTVRSPGSIHWAGALGGVSSRRHPLVQHVKVCRTHSSDSDSDRNKTLHTPLASSKEVILWWGENPCSAPISEVFPPDSAPSGRAPVGVSPFSCNTCSDSSLRAQC